MHLLEVADLLLLPKVPGNILWCLALACWDQDMSGRVRESGAAVKVTSQFLFPIILSFSWGHECSQSEAGRNVMERPRGVDRQEESGSHSMLA